MAKKKGAGGKPQDFNEENGQYGPDTSSEEKSASKEYRQNESYDVILNEGESDKVIHLPDELLPRSVGAKWANYDVSMPDGLIAHFVEGTRLHHKQIFAGRGTKVLLRNAARLTEKYGGKEEDWCKIKGYATLEVDGKSFDAEIHWYENQDGEKYEIKYKRELL